MRLIDADHIDKRIDESIFDADDNEWMHAVVANAPTIEPKQEWIPCEERLPEDGGDYIVTGKAKYSWETEWNYFVDVASNYGNYIDDYWDTFNDWNEGQEVHIIAWMPLPQPYKMQSVVSKTDTDNAKYTCEDEYAKEYEELGLAKLKELRAEQTDKGIDFLAAIELGYEMGLKATEMVERSE